MKAQYARCSSESLSLQPIKFFINTFRRFVDVPPRARSPWAPCDRIQGLHEALPCSLNPTTGSTSACCTKIWSEEALTEVSPHDVCISPCLTSEIKGRTLTPAPCSHRTACTKRLSRKRSSRCAVTARYLRPETWTLSLSLGLLGALVVETLILRE
jgi:hypothetical protein